MLNLDTHILIYALDGTLLPRERAALTEERWGISAIVLWEIAMLARYGKIARGLDDPALGRVIERITVWPLDMAVCRQSVQMDFRSDPADELIAATSVVHQVPLITRDRKMRRSKLLEIVR